MDMERCKVPTDRLTCTCRLEELDFETTNELPPLQEPIGQERAMRALEFGLNVESLGYNVFVSGFPGTGRNTTLSGYLQSIARSKETPLDWCYVHNFKDPSQPLAVSLPAGTGIALAKDMQELVEGCQRHIPRAFEGEEYQRRIDEMLSDIQAQRDRVTHEIEEEAQRRGFSIQYTSMGIVATPLKSTEAPVDLAASETLPEENNGKLREANEILQGFIHEKIRQIRGLDKEASKRRGQVDQDVIQYATAGIFEDLMEKYRDFPKLLAYLENVQTDVLEKMDDFRATDQHQKQLSPAMLQAVQEQQFIRYRVNVLVNNQNTAGAPVVFEYRPTYYNLFGRIEYQTQMGAASTDLTMIKAGAIHRANEGFLVLQARDLLSNTFVWDTMKRILRSQEVRIENLGEQSSGMPFSTLAPEPIPLKAKIIVVGNPSIYRTLQFHDEDFRKFFKVKADFNVDMERNRENMRKYASFVVNRVRTQKLRPFDKGAIARLIEYSSRIVGHQGKLTAHFMEIADLITEAAYWSGREGINPHVTSEHVERAVREKVHRSNLSEERIREVITDGTIDVQTNGAVVGQVNGLSIIDLGDYSFGVPARITARHALGRGDVVNIDYETQMAGRIHNKGFRILVGFLMGKFGQDKSLAFNASICFEQTYNPVDGDSASCAELYALLSSLSDMPIKQSLAVTGSVNQHGQVQAVGGVTRKIEGFFDVCRLQGSGLTGEQGVIIPKDNVKNLVLRADVVDAVKGEKFNIYAVDTIEEGIETLVGVSAGEVQRNKKYPRGSLFEAVDTRIRDLAKKARRQGRLSGEDGSKGKEPTKKRAS